MSLASRKSIGHHITSWWGSSLAETSRLDTLPFKGRGEPSKIQQDTAAIRWHAYLIAIVVVLWAIISIVNAVSAAR